MDDPEILALIPAIKEQMETAETAFIATAFHELRNEHQIEEDEALYMLAFCLADEIEQMTKNNRPFQIERYQQLIGLLPHLP